MSDPDLDFAREAGKSISAYAADLKERCEEAERERDEALWRLGVLREAVCSAIDAQPEPVRGDGGTVLWVTEMLMEAVARIEGPVPPIMTVDVSIDVEPKASFHESHLDRANLAARETDWQAATYWAVRALLDTQGN